MNMLEIHAREALGLPDDWHLYYACMGRENSDVPPGMVKIAGCCAPKKRNGGFAWTKAPKESHRIHFFNWHEHQEWIVEWERRTGKCANCIGKGKVIGRVSKAGTEYQPCPLCEGTGKSKNHTSIV